MDTSAAYPSGQVVSIHGLPRETVWKIKTAPILESHERADWDQQTLFGRTVLAEIRFNEPYSYFPDSLRETV
jgi:hypothetical protein